MVYTIGPISAVTLTSNLMLLAAENSPQKTKLGI